MFVCAGRDLYRPDPSVPGYVGHAIELPADAQTGTWLLEWRMDPVARKADAVWAFHAEEFLPERMKLSLAAPRAAMLTNRFGITVPPCATLRCPMH